MLRKLLRKLEKQSKVKAEDRAAALQGGTRVKVRERASRRAVKDSKLDEAKAAARSAAAARQLLAWYNTKVGPGLLEYAQAGEGRRIHILDATKIEKSRSRREIMNAAEWSRMMMMNDWDECKVSPNACVIRFFNEKKKAIEITPHTRDCLRWRIF